MSDTLPDFNGLTVVNMPGSSLMELSETPTGWVFVCPGCRASLEITKGISDEVSMVHEDDCEIYARIREALAVQAAAARGRPQG